MDAHEFRETGHRLIDWIGDYLDTVEQRPLFPDVTPEQLHALFAEDAPAHGIPAEQVMGELETKFFPYCSHVSHPGYMGLITPTPTPMGILGDLITSALNQNIGAYTIGPSGVALERRVVRWLCDMVGYSAGAGGNMTSGGMTANFIALKVGRDAASGDRMQHEGVRAACAVYVSEERHVSVDKAVDAVGLGRNALRALPTDDDFRLRIDALEAALAHDRAHDVQPLCIVGMGGSTNTGAVDDLATLRRIADREGAWLHVDAAYGGGMLLSSQHPGRLDGVQLADSVTIDPHKWFFAPLDAGAVLVKDERRLTHSFGMQPAYLTDEMDSAKERYQYYVHGFEQSRRLRALKVWMSFKRYGTTEIGRWIDRNVEQALHLYQLVQQSDDFEAATRPTMSAICIRYVGVDLSEAESGKLHREVARQVEQAGEFWISTTVLKGKSYFRINPVNFRTRLEHMDRLLNVLRAACRERAAT